MQVAALSPFSVVSYNRDYVIEFVRYTTRWHDRSEVAKKAQLQYLCNYLETDHISCKTIVAESEYIDKHFLEDYAEYYARCFPNHPRKCSRLHFFSEDFSERDFRESLDNFDKSIVEKLQRSYLGFAVIRPIPHTVFARVCLAPYKQIMDNPANWMITRRVSASLFGIDLTVSALPFIEQDKVVAACATSALWVTLGANEDIQLNNMPSPSRITKCATAGGAEANRTFPTSGLYPAQILRALRHFGLEASIAWDGDQGISKLKSLAYAHIKSNSPIILGGELYKKVKNSVVYVGSHLISVVGYAIGEREVCQGEKLNLFSDRIKKFYVHDDRCGPYLRLDLTDTSVEYEQAGKAINISVQEMGVKGHGTWYFQPTMAVIGVYHKVRITHQQITDVCEALHWCLRAELDRVENIMRTDKAAQEDFSAFPTALSSALNACWEIHLVTATTLKQEIWCSDSFYSYNGAIDKSEILASSMPKYIWVCRLIVHGAGGERCYAEIIFDATEIPQGQILVGFVAHCEDAHVLWALIESGVKNRSWPCYDSGDPDMDYRLSSFLRFFSNESNSAYLNALYGPIGLPRRSLKPGEASESYHVARRTDLLVIRRGEQSRSWDTLQKGTRYIWVVNEFGDIVVGEDIQSDDGFQGHPTLLDGKPGRIAGELLWGDSIDSWSINLKSRAYSSHIDDDYREQYLKNVIENNMVGIKVVS
jgi:hypothetical protein